MKKRYLVACYLFFFGLKAPAQDQFLAGLMPSMNLNMQLSSEWRLNFRMESRLIFLEGFFGQGTEGVYQQELSDFIWQGVRKIGLNDAIAGGYMLRIERGGAAHRLIQQYTLVQRFPAFRIAHRISSDQTFSHREAAEYRLRYRITPEIPLSGRAIDPGEFYLKINHEYLQSFQEGEYDLEVRLVPLLGYEFSKNNKIEGGLDYRIRSFIQGNSRSSFWMSIQWFFSLD